MQLLKILYSSTISHLAAREATGQMGRTHGSPKNSVGFLMKSPRSRKSLV